MVVWILLSSLVSGVVAGMGMGGGTVLIPVLTIFFGFQQQFAQGLNLLAFLPTAVVSLIIHFKNKLVDVKSSAWILSSGLLFSVLGSLLATSLKARLLQVLFGVFLLLVGAFQLVTVFIPTKKKTASIKGKVVIGSSLDLEK